MRSISRKLGLEHSPYRDRPVGIKATSDALKNLAGLYKKMGRPDEAAKLEDRVKRLGQR